MQIGGSIDRDDTGELTGVLRETAMELLSSLTKAKGGLKVPPCCHCSEQASKPAVLCSDIAATLETAALL